MDDRDTLCSKLRFFGSSLPCTAVWSVVSVNVASSPGRIFSNGAEGSKFGLVFNVGVIVRMRKIICLNECREQ